MTKSEARRYANLQECARRITEAVLKCALAKLDAEIAATRKTLAVTGKWKE